MKKLITLLAFMAFMSPGYGEKIYRTMFEQAKAEHWTFNFDPDAPARSTGFKPHFKEAYTYEALEDLDIEIPESYDLRTKGLSPIKNQGSCGSCWAFAITAMLVDDLILFSGADPKLQLSEQYLVDCAKGMFGCGGGTHDALNEVVVPKGSPSLASYPYVARNGRCQTKPTAGSALEWHYVGASNRQPTVEELKKAILEYGEISIVIGADNPLVAYKGGIYNACSNQSVNHMTNLVGWDDKDQVWIMRNSWGTAWGENGYGRIKYKGRNGRPCNNIGVEAAFVKVTQKPVPPVQREFTMESQNMKLKVTLAPENKLKVDEAKKTLQAFLDEFDRE